MSAGDTWSDPILAVYGGSFDPPHVAHVLVAAWAKSVAAVDEVLVVPTWAHAFGKRSAPFEHRVAMCEAAFRDLPFVRVSRIEQTLGAPSRTWRTLEALRKERPDARFRLVIGADILGDTHRWERWDEVAAAAPPLVVGREGHAPAPGPCPVALPDVSSTEIRDRLAAREPVEGWLPPGVAQIVLDRGLYVDGDVHDRKTVPGDLSAVPSVHDRETRPDGIEDEDPA
ncbi:MAG: nicotinate (nicotinamide) nucleotide adenylyltransferase [Myxococcota bacterium]